MKFVVAGGTGFLGRKLIGRLVESHHSVTLLSRSPEQARNIVPPDVHVFRWDAKNLSEWKETVSSADGVINLAGVSIGDHRWTDEHKRAVMESRENSTNAIIRAIADSRVKPKVLVNASAVGYYGNVEQGDVTEDHPKGEGFLAMVVERWEQVAQEAKQHGVRVVTPRFGIVLGSEGGALQKLLFPFRMFVGGAFGSGRQWFPWVHIEDVVGAIIVALEHPSLSGPVNVAAPDHVTTKQFCTALGKAIHRPSWAPVPGLALKVLLGGQMAEELLLWGQRVVPKKLLEAGYQFKFPKLDEALRDIVAR